MTQSTLSKSICKQSDTHIPCSLLSSLNYNNCADCRVIRTQIPVFHSQVHRWKSYETALLALIGPAEDPLRPSIILWGYHFGLHVSSIPNHRPSSSSYVHRERGNGPVIFAISWEIHCQRRYIWMVAGQLLRAFRWMVLRRCIVTLPIRLPSR